MNDHIDLDAMTAPAVDVSSHLPSAHDDLLTDDFSANAFAGTPLWTVADVAGQVISLWMRAKLDRDKAHQALAALVVVEADGTAWSLGATTRRWFRRVPGGEWRLARPPADTASLVEPAAQAVEAALWLLGVNPGTVTEDATEAAPLDEAPLGSSSTGDLLDDLLEGYGV